MHRLHYYAHSTGVLEEEVTAAGVHRFTALAPGQASARLAASSTRWGPSPPAGSRMHVQASALASHPLAQRLAQTRALSVLTVVRTADGDVQQVSAYATAQGVLTMEALDPSAQDPELEFRAVDAKDLHALATVVVVGRGEPRVSSLRAARSSVLLSPQSCSVRGGARQLRAHRGAVRVERPTSTPEPTSARASAEAADESAVSMAAASHGGRWFLPRGHARRRLAVFRGSPM